MRLNSTKDLILLRCGTAECVFSLQIDLSKIEKVDIITCDFGHRHLIKIIEVKKINNNVRYEIEIITIDNPGFYL